MSQSNRVRPVFRMAGALIGVGVLAVGAWMLYSEWEEIAGGQLRLISPIVTAVAIGVVLLRVAWSGRDPYEDDTGRPRP